jgi:uncharacterized glyoxalase superfamily protein PhnB
MTNRSMPPGRVIPELGYDDVATAAAWLCEAFGFRERLRIADHRIQLTFEDASVVATDGGAAGSGRRDRSVMVRVDDVDAHFARASAAGARILRPPETHPFGERQYTAEDPGGHAWTFSQSVRDVDPAEWGGELLEAPPPPRLYMVIERYRNGDAVPVYRRFREHGRLAPEGLRYVASWVNESLTVCYQVMETRDRALLDAWIGRWSDLVDFEVVEVVSSAEAAARVPR